MKDLVTFTFDLLGHVLPGLIVLFAFSLFYIPAEGAFGEIYKMTGEIEGGVGPVIIIVAYIVGFGINPMGKYLYMKIGPIVCKKKPSQEIKMSASEKFVLLREFSPNNFEYVERWNTYCTMSHNLAVGFLVLIVSSIVKAFASLKEPYDLFAIWLSIAIVSAILFFVFIYRAAVLRVWAQDDLNASITALNLDKKAE